ncbi:MAG: glycosyltransferase family 2 protein [Rhizobium sp.]|nr:glycosyl transferase family 2 [Bradyrhizobium elkanii]MBK5653259.1 glycosyltransferase family 2 protein [Rhizobium sp.]
MTAAGAVALLVAIVNYRVADLVIDCLRSVAREISSVPGTQVVVCENGTGDDSATRIQQAITDNGWGDWCSLIPLAVNLGFTGGNNVIIKPAMSRSDPPEYVLLLNPDTIVRPNAFKALVDFMDRNPKVGIAGSRLEDPDGTPQRSAFRFHSPFGEFEANLKLGLVSRLLARWVVAPPVRDDTFETDWVSGASMIIRRQVIETTGLLDEGYFTYFDDIDYCFNARRKGWPTWYVPASRVVHLVGQSTGVNAHAKRIPPYLLEARRRYFLKNHGPLYAALADIGMIAGLSLWRLRVLLTGREDKSPPHLLADSLRHSVFSKGFMVSDVKLRP